VECCLLLLNVTACAFYRVRWNTSVLFISPFDSCIFKFKVPGVFICHLHVGNYVCMYIYIYVVIL
jgi:hypothetical protein